MLVKHINNEITVVLSKELFSREAVINFIYWNINEFDIKLYSSSSKYRIQLFPYDTTSPIDDDCVRLIKRQIIDHQLRHIIKHETKNVRDLLTAKAFESSKSGK